MDKQDFGEVSNISDTFRGQLRKYKGRLIALISAFILWDVGYIYLSGGRVLESDMGFNFLILPWVFLIMWMGTVMAKIREAFWIQLSKKYGWTYARSKDLSKEKALLFSLGHSRRISHGVAGQYMDHPFQIFEYEYSTGSGKHKQTFGFTVFEIKFTGSFPHLYLNYKKDGHSSRPSPGLIAQISLPAEFQNKFDFYSPKEYEIETLEIFTPDVFEQLLNLGWNHDMEFVDGELVIYRKVRLNSLAELEGELQKIRTFIETLAPRLNRFKLTPIGDVPYMLTKG